MSALDTQVGGDHYKNLKIQPMEYSMANGLDACQHTAIKYITRFRDKGGIADLEKAKHCIDMLIEFERDGWEEVDPVEPCENWTMAVPPASPLPATLPQGWTDIREPHAPWAVGTQLELLMINGQTRGPVSYEPGMLFPDVAAWRFGVPLAPKRLLCIRAGCSNEREVGNFCDACSPI